MLQCTCLHVGAYEFPRQTPTEKVHKEIKVSTSKWLFQSNNLHLNDFSTKTLKMWGLHMG